MNQLLNRETKNITLHMRWDILTVTKKVLTKGATHSTLQKRNTFTRQDTKGELLITVIIWNMEGLKINN